MFSTEESGSSLDGEIGFADNSGNPELLDASLSSIDRSADLFRAAPREESIFSRNEVDMDPHNLLSETILTEDSLRPLHAAVHHKFTSRDAPAPGNICDILLPSCMKINEMLSERCLFPIDISAGDIDANTKSVSVFVLDSWAESVVTALEEVLQRHDRQNQSVQETSFSSRTVEASREAMEKHIRDLQKKLDSAERKLSARSLESDNLEESFEKNEKKTKSFEKESQRKIKNLENVVREGERKLKMADMDMERMKKKLEQCMAREQEAKNRYSDILSGSAVVSLVKGVSATPPSKSRMMKVGKKAPPSPEDVVKALDAERVELEQSNAELTEQVQNLTDALRDLENRNRFGGNIGEFGERERRPHGQIGDDSNDGGNADEDSVEYVVGTGTQGRGEIPGSLKVLFAKIKDQQHRIEQLVHREGILEAENRRCEEALDIYRQRSSAMMEEIESLRIELDGRPSVRAFSQKQKEVTELESKLHDVVMMRKEAAEVASFKKYLSTSDRIKADKRNHELGLWIIESVPTAVVKEILQSACRELDISDISELQPSIVKLKSVVRTVPRIEAFATKLCGFVFDRQRPTYPEGDVKEDPVLEDVFPIIKKWWSQLTRGSELFKFQEAILKQLDRRERILGAASRNDSDDAGRSAEVDNLENVPFMFAIDDVDAVFTEHEWKTNRRAMWMKRDPRVALEIVADLVNYQLETFQDTHCYRSASDYIAQNPEKMVNRLLSHLQYVFDVKDLQGLVPRMNQVYLFVEEFKNLMASLRSCLDMKDAQNAVIITECLRRLSNKN